jgi:malonate transporter and related proteins
MSNLITIVLPVFALIAVGYAAGRFRLFSSESGKVLNDYTFQLAVPALLFRSMARLEVSDIPLDLWVSFFGAAFLTWLVASVLTATMLGRPAIDTPSIAMSSSFGNVVMLGIPLSLAAFGETAAAPAALIVALHTPLLFFAGALHQALVAEPRQTNVVNIVRDLFLELARNPIILAIAAGILWRATGLGLDPGIDRVLLMLGQSAVATSLVGLGLSLIQFEIKGQAPTLSMILVLKLALMPCVAWLLAVHVFALRPVAAAVVVLFAAMPTGANAFIFASRSGRAVNSASGAVALGTIFAVISAALIIQAFSTR